MFGNLFDVKGIIESLLPPGKTLDDLQKIGEGLAARVVQLADDMATIKQVQAQQDVMLRQTLALCQSLNERLRPPEALGAQLTLEHDHEPATPDESLSPVEPSARQPVTQQCSTCDERATIGSHCRTCADFYHGDSGNTNTGSATD